MSPVNWGGAGQGGHHTYKTASILQTKCANGSASATPSGGWVDIMNVTMTAQKDDSVYHLTIQGNAQGNGKGGRHGGSARPRLRILRNGATRPQLGHVNGWEGRAGHGYSQNANNNYDAGQLSYTVKDEPGLNAGQNVNYKAQLWSAMSGYNPVSVNFGQGVFGTSGGSLTVMEIDTQ